MKKLILLCSAFLLMQSCSKDDKDNDEPTVAELLANKWFLVEVENTSTDPSTITLADECSQKTYYNFLNDGTLIVQGFGFDGGDTCKTGEINGYTYILSADGKQIIVKSETSTEFLVINAISSGSLTLHNSDIPLTITFKK